MDSSVAWDENPFLRHTLFSADRLVSHAVELAIAHGVPSSRVGAGPLRARFTAAKARIRDIYQLLSRSVREDRTASPAEDWLIDNSHVVEEQIREIRDDLPWGYLVRLPRLSVGVMAGYPRVYGLCLDYLRHTDARIDLATLTSFVNAYQSVHALTIGELWAVPIMLRMGLILLIGAIADSGANMADRHRGDEWAARVLRDGHSPEEQAECLADIDASGSPVTAAALVQFLRHLREHEAATPLHVVSTWIRQRCVALHTSPEELVRSQHLKQAAEQVSVGNGISSMRTIGAFKWSAFFEATSQIEAVLRADPSGDYLRMDSESRDSYRHAVEDISRRSPCDELTVVKQAQELAEKALSSGSHLSVSPLDHIGYYLVDDGRCDLEKVVRYRPSLAVWIRRFILAHPSLVYLGSLATLSALALVASARWLIWPESIGVSLVLMACLAMVVSEIVISSTSSLFLSVLPPRLLPRFELKRGVPEEYATLVVVPSLIDSAETVAKLLDDLEVRALANPDTNLHFGLLTDFTDAASETTPDDDSLLDLALSGIARLNQRHSTQRFVLFHRKRIQNRSSGLYMGWERKRGKLEELNRLLRGATDTSFSHVTAPLSSLLRFKNVITLDADTDLPRDVARRLAATLAHPLNRPVVDASGTLIARGHAILQPRVGTVPLSARQTRFSRISSGPSGIDPYTTAVSDLYQDLFGEGSFVGKGIYDVDAFTAVMRGRVPDNRLLSHDLLEGIYARAALVTDIEILDEQPASYAVAAGRQHRWIRGDWQLLPWLFARRGALRALDRWKIVDNLRRSLLPAAVVLFCCVCWLEGGMLAWVGSAALAVMFVLPVVTRFVRDLFRHTARTSTTGSIRGALVDNTLQSLVTLTFLPDQAILAVDAVMRTLFRVMVSGKSMLEWKTMHDAERARGLSAAWPGGRMGVISAVSFGVFVWLALRSPATLYLAMPLLLWSFAPVVAYWLERKEVEVDRSALLTPAHRELFREVSWKTWRFFETFVTADENHLPPDNFQEEPRGVVAHRTSPTNMGLYLLSQVTARDFGFISLASLVERLDLTLSSIERLERRDGHVLNWYDTTSLRPLEPMYVSTVDSGNLAGYLWTLQQACFELKNRELGDVSAQVAATDAIRLAVSNLVDDVGESIVSSRAALLALSDRLEADCASLASSSALGSLLWMEQAAEEGSALLVREGVSRGVDSNYWLARAVRVLEDTSRELRALWPFLGSQSNPPSCLRSGLAGDPWSDLDSCLRMAVSPERIAGLDELAKPSLERLSLAVRAIASDVERDEAQAFLRTIEEQISASSAVARTMCDALDSVGARATRLADGMDFAFLYDEERELFSIGYNVSSARRDASHYDLLASEARLGSLVAIAKGDVSQKHWFRLSRPRTRLASGEVLMSWSGSMFEFLMPLLVTKNAPRTLLHESYGAAVLSQIEYANSRSVPWGISEAAYNVMDLGMTYQYRAFGVPGLGLKSGLADDLVIAPYATALAALVRPDLAVANLKRLIRSGAQGRYGFYDAIDFTPTRVPPGHTSVVVKTFMAHHSGMTLIALGEVLHGSPMQRRFHADPRVKATELLLEERVPTGGPTLEPRSEMPPNSPQGDSELDIVERVGLSNSLATRAHLLGQGELSTVVTERGEGFTTWNGLDLNRFREDPALGCGGTFLYVRRVDNKKYWSAGFQPTRVEPDYYDVSFGIDRIEICRRDGDIETVTHVTVSPELPVEVRRVTLTNHGALSREIELTSYTEIVLATHASDLAHRAFGSMFVETELLADSGVVIAHRRTKSPSEPEVWMAQMMIPDRESWTDLDFDTSRAAFIGRGRSPENPIAMERSSRLARSEGAVLDPAIALRRRVTLRPGGRARLSLVTGMASSREALLQLVERLQTPHAIARTFELAWSDARVELKHLGITATQSHRFQWLLSLVMFPRSTLRASTGPAGRGWGRGVLWSHGISGDVPILLVLIDDPEFSSLLRETLLAQEFWRLNGIAVDVVIVNEEAAGYLQPVQDAILSTLAACPSNSRINQRGGVFVRRSQEMNDDDRATLLCAARVLFRSSQGSMARQLRRANSTANLTDDVRVSSPRKSVATLIDDQEASPARKLHFDNGLGGFSADGREYEIRLAPGVQTPAPWCNVIANPTFGTLVSERGSSFTWRGNSQRHRLTPWSNDPVSDPSGEAIYLRDESDGSIWSATPDPAGEGATYRVRHGQGYTVFEHTRGPLVHELTELVSMTAPVKIFRLRIVNEGASVRTISVFGVIEWVLGNHRENNRLTVSTEWTQEKQVLLANNPLGSSPGHVAFFTATKRVRSGSADRTEVFGVAGTRSSPAGLRNLLLSGRAGVGLDPCGAIQVTLVIAPGETSEVSFVLGESDDGGSARELATRFGRPEVVEDALREVIAFWNTTLGAVQVKTPDLAFDLLVNRWLLYQVLSCRFWGRSGFYQSGGAYGFRDQLQDVLALLHSRPELARAHILTAAGRQFVAGDVQHWWHPESGEGVRTRCSDDLLWLPFVVLEYVRVTGDAGLLEEQIPFLKERDLQPDEVDLFGTPAISENSGSIYDHCVRALECGATAGVHGLPRFRGGDWNDGMNRVGPESSGESVWLAWFLGKIAEDFRRLAVSRRDLPRAEWCADLRQSLTTAVDEFAWDGRWYRRGFFDDGTALGTQDSVECKIDAIAQSWATLSGMANPVRARLALRESEALLVRGDDKMMALLWPPFDGAGNDPGYIAAYPPGVRENGGQYTHGVLWTVQALAMAGEGQRAGDLLAMLNPIRHGSTPAQINKYKVEPYVVAADVYTAPGHVGRGGWSWYTGSASVMYRIAVEDVLGLKRLGHTLRVEPSVPRDWEHWEVSYRMGQSTLRIEVQNPERVEHGVRSILVDGVHHSGPVALNDEAGSRAVLVTMGDLDSLSPDSE